VGGVRAADSDQQFECPGKKAVLSTTIDLGVVVSGVEIGQVLHEAVASEVRLDVPGDYAKDVGLTDGKPLKVRVLVLGDGDAAANSN
jgi:hypothetical protein